MNLAGCVKLQEKEMGEPQEQKLGGRRAKGMLAYSIVWLKECIQERSLEKYSRPRL